MAYHPLRAAPGTGVIGRVYLIHLDQKVGHAQHYTGWYANPVRLEHHERGTGARLLAVARDRGIGWRVVEDIPGDRNLERQLKNRGGAKRRCPICKEAGNARLQCRQGPWSSVKEGMRLLKYRLYFDDGDFFRDENGRTEFGERHSKSIMRRMYPTHLEPVRWPPEPSGTFSIEDSKFKDFNGKKHDVIYRTSPGYANVFALTDEEIRQLLNAILIRLGKVS